MRMQAEVLMRDFVSREATRDIPVASVSNSKRYIEPTEKTINAMMVSFKLLGQLSPIIVHAVTRNSYRIVAGQTRFKAASKLGWKTIRAEIIAASAIDYKIIELAENVDRRDLSAAQRRECKGLLRQMLRERFNAIAAGKAGRGHKGGLREAARQAGVPESTARKLRENTDIRAISNPEIPPTSSLADANKLARDVAAWVEEEKIRLEPEPRIASASEFSPRTPRVKTADLEMASPLSVKVTVAERERVERFNAEKCGGDSLSNCVRRLIREGLQRYGYWHEPTGNGAGADDEPRDVR